MNNSTVGYPIFYLKLLTTLPKEVLSLIYSYAKFRDSKDYMYLYDSLDIMVPVLKRYDNRKELVLNIHLSTRTNPSYLKSDRPMNVNMLLKVSGEDSKSEPDTYNLFCWDLVPDGNRTYTLDNFGLAFTKLPREMDKKSVMPFQSPFSVKPCLEMDDWEKKNWKTFKQRLIKSWKRDLQMFLR